MTQPNQYTLAYLKELNKKAQSRVDFWKGVLDATVYLLPQIENLEKLMPQIEHDDEPSNPCDKTLDYESSDEEIEDLIEEEIAPSQRNSYKYKESEMRRIMEIERHFDQNKKLFYEYQIKVSEKIINTGRTTGFTYYNAMVRATQQKYYAMIHPALQKSQKVTMSIWDQNKKDKVVTYQYLK